MSVIFYLEFCNMFYDDAIMSSVKDLDNKIYNLGLTSLFCVFKCFNFEKSIIERFLTTIQFQFKV